ncbi:unnamed protein product [Echinostoma caproni]|uniref:Pecanex-like protein n=1 Tax=Echinostoma caproni TaxID=27848 RepID=A0A183ATI5_9TREM|nr:unnamed protein product [Echinostoma caproni]
MGSSAEFEDNVNESGGFAQWDFAWNLWLIKIQSVRQHIPDASCNNMILNKQGGSDANWTGDIHVLTKDDWVLTDIELLQAVITPAMRIALKLYQDNFLWASEMTHAGLHSKIIYTEKNFVICHETDPQWRFAVLNDAHNLFSIRLMGIDTDNVYRFVQLTKGKLNFSAVKLKHQLKDSVHTGRQSRKRSKCQSEQRRILAHDHNEIGDKGIELVPQNARLHSNSPVDYARGDTAIGLCRPDAGDSHDLALEPWPSFSESFESNLQAKKMRSSGSAQFTTLAALVHQQYESDVTESTGIGQNQVDVSRPTRVKVSDFVKYNTNST